jgi:hypothetical protein
MGFAEAPCLYTGHAQALKLGVEGQGALAGEL